MIMAMWDIRHTRNANNFLQSIFNAKIIMDSPEVSTDHAACVISAYLFEG